MIEETAAPKENFRGWSKWFAQGCLLVALSGSAYLATIALLRQPLAGCGPASGCNRVLSSRWAYWVGLPVSLPAFVSYATLLFLSHCLEGTPAVRFRRLAWSAALSLSLLVLGAAFWFVTLQLMVVKAWCRFCLATHLSGSVAATIILAKAVAWSRSGRGQERANAAWAGEWLLSILGACLGLCILVSGQLFSNKRFYAVRLFSGLTSFKSHEVSFHNGKFKLDPDEVPSLGPASGTNLIVSLFDYTCSHCRALRPLLLAVQQNYQGRLRIVALPAPLDAGCNSLLLVTAPANQDACEYARIALALWHTRPVSFRELDDWIFASATPPPLDQVRAKAEELIGSEALKRALSDPWVEQQLQVDISLYQANARSVEDARLPQLMIGDSILHGTIESEADLLSLINRNLQLTPSSAPTSATP